MSTLRGLASGLPGGGSRSSVRWSVAVVVALLLLSPILYDLGTGGGR